ncbi:MAG: cobalamin-binding protein [Desulfobacterales bacterium]
MMPAPNKNVCIALGLMIVFIAQSAVVYADRRVTDQLGRTITFPDNPKRIVSMAPNITEIMYALNQQHRLVGATLFSDYPPEAEEIPKVGSYVHLDIERIVALQPDLCFATKDGNPIEVVGMLDSMDIPVYAVNPRNLDTVMKTLLEIGALLNAEANAQRVVSQMKKRIQRVTKRVAHADSRPKVFCQIGINPIVSAGTDTCIHELIEMAGGKNIAEGPVPYPRFSREQILSLAPDIFIITSMARGAVFESVQSDWKKFPSIPAVRNHRIMLVNSNILDRPTPRLVDGLEMLARIIHPVIFKE